MDIPLVPTNEDISKIENNLFMGNLATACNQELMVKYKIKRILSVLQTQILDKDRVNDIQYKYINLWDTEYEDIISYFPECIEFISDGQKRDENVFVHCRAGRSRSATVIIAFVMKKYGYDLDKTLKKIMTSRNGINPNIGFRHQLKLWQKMNYELLGTDIEYRRVLVSGLKNRILIIIRFGQSEGWQTCSEAINSAFICYSQKVLNVEKCIKVMDRGKTYRCFKCSNVLFKEINEIKNKVLDSNCGSVYIEPQKWILHQIITNSKTLLELMSGNVFCVKCGEGLGVYDWRSRSYTCVCEAHKRLDYYLIIKIHSNKLKAFDFEDIF